MKNKFASLLGPLWLIISCTLHDTGYLQKGDASGGGAGDTDSAGGEAAGGRTDAVIGGAGEGGVGEGGAGEGGATTGGSNAAGAGALGSCGDDQVKCGSSDMIADFESNDGRLCVPGSGTVISYGDGTGTTSPALGDVKSYNASDDCDRGSAYALHALVGGAEDWGFGIALRFPQNIDAVEAGYKGIRFKAKAASARKISIKVAIPATLDASFGGSCEPTQSPPMKLCNDHPAAAVVVAAGGWLEYKVAFSSLKQEGWGVPAEPDFSAIAQLHVVLPGPVSGGDADYDVWLDDFEFYQ